MKYQSKIFQEKSQWFKKRYRSQSCLKNNIDFNKLIEEEYQAYLKEYSFLSPPPQIPPPTVTIPKKIEPELISQPDTSLYDYLKQQEAKKVSKTINHGFRNPPKKTHYMLDRKYGGWVNAYEPIYSKKKIKWTLIK